MLIIGHRGARGLATENTKAGLQKALEYLVDMVEFDVRVTKDAVPVLHHDQKLLDASGNSLTISNFDFVELKKHKPDLMTLEEALKNFASKIPLYIEVKGGEPEIPIVQVIKKFQHNKLLIGSKNQRTLREIHKLLPDVPKLVIETWSGIRAVRRARQVDTKTLSIYRRVLWFGFISAMKQRGYELYAYTLNDPKKARRWEKYGLAGVVTDFPDRFKR